MPSFNQGGQLTLTTSEAVYQYRAGTIAAAGTVGLTASGGRVDGFFFRDAASGATDASFVMFTPGRTFTVVVSAAVTIGAALYPSGSGKFSSVPTGGKPIGYAMAAATADGDQIQMRPHSGIEDSEALVAAGATLTLTAASHGGKTILLDTLAGSVVTLPAASGTGVKFKFRVSVAPTSNFHQVKVANSSDTMAGSVNILDNDAAAQTAYAATSTDDNIQMNGTTKGGLVGDFFECVDIATNKWGVFGQLVVPAGSNPADVFSAAV